MLRQRETLSGLVFAIVATGLPSAMLPAAEPAPFVLSWEKNILTIRRPLGASPQIPGGSIRVNYIEAYCRPGSTDRDWGKTTIGHRTEIVGGVQGSSHLVLRCTLKDGVVVDHDLRGQPSAIEFQLTAHNPTNRESSVQWAQPCVRVDRFTGRTQQTYLDKCFIFVDGKLTRLPTSPWATQGKYVPGQVWAPRGVDRNDVNPRPLSRIVPSNGLIGCFSADEKTILATAWEPYQELFQGVVTCIHSDFRIGGLKPNETKRIRGKLYITDSGIGELLDRYKRDFVRGSFVCQRNGVSVDNLPPGKYPSRLHFAGPVAPGSARLCLRGCE
jgi:hypothetical protein